MNSRAPIVWRCRRGIKELDLLFASFLRNCYPRLSDTEKTNFEGLLAEIKKLMITRTI